MRNPQAEVPDAELQAFVDRRLAPERAAEIARRLAGDPLLASTVAAYRYNDDRLRAALRALAGDAVPARLADAIDRPVSTRAYERRRRVAAAIAAMLFVAAGSAGWWATGPFESGQNAAIERWNAVAVEAVYAHRLYAHDPANPVEMTGADRLELSGWLARHLDQPGFIVPDMTQKHFRLLGARLLPAGTDTAALVMYENGFGERLTLYVRNGQTGESGPRWIGQPGGGAFYWVDDGCSYVVTGLASRQSVEEFGRALMEQLEGSGPEQG